MMSSFIDKKYINLVSGQLSLFKWKSSTLANCRCPICGDSQKNKTKCRGYFYEKKNAFFYRCHNCGYGSSVKNFLDKVAPSLLQEYQVETFNEKFGGRKKREKKEIESMNFKPFVDGKPGFVRYTKLSSLNEDHVCKKFVIDRKIPEDWYDKLYYTEDFNTFAKKLINKDANYPKDERLVIPFLDENGDMYAAQGRKLEDNDNAKYYTVKPKNLDKLWFNQHGVDTEKTVIVVEGPIDSMFLSNSVAMVGAGAITNLPEFLQNKDVIYALDNEPRNSQIVSFYENIIKANAKICIWPPNIFQKDINEIILSGMSSAEVENLIHQNSYRGLEAKIKMKDWKKI